MPLTAKAARILKGFTRADFDLHEVEASGLCIAASYNETLPTFSPAKALWAAKDFNRVDLVERAIEQLGELAYAAVARPVQGVPAFVWEAYYAAVEKLPDAHELIAAHFGVVIDRSGARSCASTVANVRAACADLGSVSVRELAA
ncbi:MAG: hypothetical protein V4696_07605 [Pseudomonadota bacterium]